MMSKKEMEKMMDESMQKMKKKMMNKMEKMMSEEKPSPKKVEPHHAGKGTKARINTMAEKMLFNSHISD